jgi:hypothetical protein
MARGVWSVPTRYWLPVVFLATLPVAGLAQQEYRCVVLDSTPHLYGRAYGAGGGLVAGYGGPNTGVDRAIVWDARTGARRDLHPEGYYISRAFGTDGSRVGGVASLTDSTPWHATLWDLKSGKVRDLHPFAWGLPYSEVLAVDGNDQVGVAFTLGTGRPVLWHGSAETAVDLTPSFATSAAVFDTHGGRQAGGFGILVKNQMVAHAAVWQGNSELVIDIHPDEVYSSGAWGIVGDIAVGRVFHKRVSYGHAALWDLSTHTWQDVHPAGFDQSWAVDTNGSQHVGWASLNGFKHALLWKGGKYLDLPLAPGIITAEATGIDESGYVSGVGYDESRGYALVWQPVPEPESLEVLAGSLFLVTFVWRRKMFCRRDS